MNGTSYAIDTARTTASRRRSDSLCPDDDGAEGTLFAQCESPKIAAQTRRHQQLSAPSELPLGGLSPLGALSSKIQVPPIALTLEPSKASQGTLGTLFSQCESPKATPRRLATPSSPGEVEPLGLEFAKVPVCAPLPFASEPAVKAAQGSLLFFVVASVRLDQLLDCEEHGAPPMAFTVTGATRRKNRTEPLGTEVRVNDTDITLFRWGKVVHAVQSRCPHQGAKLSGGDFELEDIEDLSAVMGQSRACVLTCPHHRWRFDVVSGAKVVPSKMRWGPAAGGDSKVLVRDAKSEHYRLPTYHTTVEDGTGAISVGFQAISSNTFESDDF